jgi:hypothetical protein
MTALTLGVPPCSAADARQHTAPKAPKAKQTLSASAEAQVAALASPRLLAQDAGTATSNESRSFFRTPTGVAAIVIMAVGGGYVLYSVKNDQDPVKSPIR